MASGAVRADYFQIELHAGEGGRVEPEVDTGLVTMVASDYAILTTARHHGELPLEVQVHDAAPPLDPTWDAVTELSLRTGENPHVAGWAHEGDEVAIAVPAGVELRVRYVVVDGDDGREQADSRWEEPPCEHYLVQVWPAPPAPPRVVVASSGWSQYWAFAAAAERAAQDCAALAEPAGLVAVVDRAFDEHPDVAHHLARGEDRYLSGVLRYAQALLQITHGRGEYAAEHADGTLVDTLIYDRARLRAAGRAEP